MVELVDTADSKSVSGYGVRVRVPLCALNSIGMLANWRATRFGSERRKTCVFESRHPDLHERQLMAKCECCSKRHDRSYGSGRFCSCLCARSYSTKRNKTEIRAKISAALKGRPLPESARLKLIGKRHSDATKLKISSSVKAAMTPSLRRKISERVTAAYTPERIAQHSKLSREAALKRTGNQWHTRKGVESRNERVVREYFESHAIAFKQEVPCGKYSLDFVITKRRRQINIEIDGHQHRTRKASDEIRDAYVTSNGYNVARFEMHYPKTAMKMEAFNKSFTAFLKGL